MVEYDRNAAHQKQLLFTECHSGVKITFQKKSSLTRGTLGETIDIEKVRSAYISARENVAEENIFRPLRLNQWVKQSTRWMQMDKWDACAFLVNEEELIGRTYYGGLDLSSTSDITAFVLVFPPRNDEEFMYRNKNCIFLPTF